MRLHVTVREGDFVTTSYAPIGCTVAYKMIDLAAFDGADTESSRWRRLDAAVLGNSCPVDVDGDAPIAELVTLAHAAARDRGLAASTDPDDDWWLLGTWITDPATDERLDPARSVRDAGLEDGDVVALCVEHPPSADYELGPAAHPEMLFSRLVLSERLTAGKPVLHGVLLYTEADAELATFVRTHFDELNALSGALLRIFVIERPPDWATAKRYWKPRLEPELYRSLAALRWLRWIPYEQFRASDIARALGVPVDAVPCLVLFGNHADQKKLVFPIRDPTAATFRRLFREIAETAGLDRPEYRLEADLDSTREAAAYPAAEPSAEVYARLVAAEQRLLAALHPAPATDRAVGQYRFHDHTVFVHIGGDVSDQFTFHGQTTFINRPVNTVITDFQNAHGTGPAKAELAELLRLVLSSSQLADADRERLAGLIDEAATEAAGDSERGKVRGILETVKTTVADASDIAGPAIGVITKVLELLGP